MYPLVVVGWVGSKFFLCDALSWVGSVRWCFELGWVKENGPTDNSGLVTV